MKANGPKLTVRGRPAHAYALRGAFHVEKIAKNGRDPTAATRFSSPPFASARVHRGALVPPASNPIVLRHVIDLAGGAEARAARMRPGPGFCAPSVREVGHAWAAASGGHRRNGRLKHDERGKNRNQIPTDCALAGSTATLGLGIAPFSSGTRSGFGRPGHITTASPPSPGGGHAWRRPGPERPGGTGRKAPCGKRSQPAKADGMPRVGAGGRPAAPHVPKGAHRGRPPAPHVPKGAQPANSPSRSL